MRHAIMVIGSGNNAEVLQSTINHLDDKDIDFYIHWDKKFRKPILHSKYSNITFIKSRKVKWGSSALVFVEYDLLREVFNSKYHYDYVHLISSTDIPLMTKNFFKDFFTQELYLGFSSKSPDTYERVRYYYPTNIINARSVYGRKIIALFRICNQILGINRLAGSNISIDKGCQWFSIKYSYIKDILQFRYMEMFKHTITADELYLQTVLNKYKPKILEDDCKMAARYIDWERGNPYIFSRSDTNELKKLVNTRYAFARKVYDPSLVDKIFEIN